MGTRGFEIVRFRGRYYVLFHHYDSYPEELGAKIVARIPTNPQRYEGTCKPPSTIFLTSNM